MAGSPAVGECGECYTHDTRRIHAYDGFPPRLSERYEGERDILGIGEAMELIACDHCGAVFCLEVLRMDHSKDRRGNQTWFIDGKEWWCCQVCHTREKVPDESVIHRH